MEECFTLPAALNLGKFCSCLAVKFCTTGICALAQCDVAVHHNYSVSDVATCQTRHVTLLPCLLRCSLQVLGGAFLVQVLFPIYLHLFHALFPYVSWTTVVDLKSEIYIYRLCVHVTFSAKIETM